MKNTSILHFLFAAVMIFCSTLSGGEPYKNRSALSFKFGKKKITVRQAAPSKHGPVRGDLPPESQVREAAKRFEKAINKLPLTFVRRLDLRFVTFLVRPRLHGKAAGGVASGDTIYLDVNCSEKTVFHELFHIFDPVRDNGKWRKLNHKDFVYTGSVFYETKKLSYRKKRRRKENLSKRTFDHDFVSRYAMSNEKEDRAETFAYMMAEGERFLRRVRRSRVLKKKMDFIMECTSGRRLMGKDFWQKHLRLSSSRY